MRFLVKQKKNCSGIAHFKKKPYNYSYMYMNIWNEKSLKNYHELNDNSINKYCVIYKSTGVSNISINNSFDDDAYMYFN